MLLKFLHRLAGLVSTYLLLLHEGFSKYSFQASSLLSELFFVQSYFGGLWPHTWSLAVEEHFYIMLIIIFYLLARSKTLSHAVIFNLGFLVIALFCFLSRCYSVVYTDNSVWQSLFQTHLRIDSLFFGVWLSYHFHFNKEKFVLVFQRYRSLIAITSMLLLLSVFFIELDSGFILTLQLSLLYLSFGGILGVFLTNSFKNAKKIIPSTLINIIVTIGFYSYSIYLFHLFGNKYLIPVFVKSVTFEVSKYVLSIIYFSSAIAMGILFSKLIELPVLAFRDKHFSRTKVINVNVK